MNDPFILFEIAKWSPEAHRVFCKSSKPYRHLLQTTGMKYLIMDAWAGDTGFYTTECGGFMTHGRIEHHKNIFTWYADDREWEFYRNGKIHRNGDLPARMTSRALVWVKDGKLHRDDDKPGVIYTENGSMSWWKEGVLHREGDLPALHIVPMTILNSCLSFSPGVPQSYQAWVLNGEIYKDAGCDTMRTHIKKEFNLKMKDDCVHLDDTVQIPQKDVDCLLSAAAYRDAHPRGL